MEVFYAREAAEALRGIRGLYDYACDLSNKRANSMFVLLGATLNRMQWELAELASEKLNPHCGNSALIEITSAIVMGLGNHAAPKPSRHTGTPSSVIENEVGDILNACQELKEKLSRLTVHERDWSAPQRVAHRANLKAFTYDVEAIEGFAREYLDLYVDQNAKEATP